MYTTMWETLIHYACSLFKGVVLGSTVYLLGTVLDNTVSRTTKDQLIETKEKLYNRAQQYVQVNLLVISPIIYGVVDQLYLTHTVFFQPVRFLGVVLIQNIGYFFMHKEMHERKSIYWMHCFHHKFDDLLLPSIGNAVHPFEFLCAYVAPIVLAAYILKPSECTYLSAIGSISVFNMFIHMQELKGWPWIPGFVSPTDHMEHHQTRTTHYAAPFVHIDTWYEKICAYFREPNSEF